MDFKISVLIITKDRPNKVKRLIECLNKQTRYPDELILVEDTLDQKNFSQTILSGLANNQYKTKYLSIKARNFSKSRNLSLNYSKGSLLFFIDDDVTIPPDFIQNTIIFFKNNPSSSGLVPKIVPISKNKYSVCASKLLNWECANVNKASKITSFAFACAIIKRQAIKKLRFDENTYTGEDIIFSTKLTRKDDAFYFVPSLKVKHNFVDNFLTFFKKFYLYGKDLPYISNVLHNNLDTAYYPKRKINILFLPLFVFKNISEWAKADLKYYRLDGSYYKVFAYYHFVIYLAVFVSKSKDIIRKTFINLKTYLTKCLYWFIQHSSSGFDLFLYQVIRGYRKRIINFDKTNYKIVSVVCHKDVVSYLAMVTSFIDVTKKNHNFYAINDGSLTIRDRLVLSKFGVQLRNVYSPKKYLRWNWQYIKYVGVKKLFPDSRIILVDSDVLFYKEPELLFQETSHYFSKDVRSWYSLSEEECKFLLNKKLTPLLNSGLLSFHTKYINASLFYSMIKALLQVQKTRITDDFVVEQTSYAVLFNSINYKRQVKRLPENYILFPNINAHTDLLKLICIHFTGNYSSQRRLFTFRYFVKRILNYP